MIGILIGFFLLLLSFYVLYLGSIMENGWIRFLGIVIGGISGILIAISRLKLNISALDKYKHALRKLAAHPDDERLKEEVYKAGVAYYKNKRDNRKLLPQDEQAIQRDIYVAVNKGKITD